MSIVIERRRVPSPPLLDRVVRLVPVEVITPYTAALAVAQGAAAHLELVLLAAGVLATVLVLALDARRHRLRACRTQHVVRVLSFAAWAFAVANPLAPAAPVPVWLPAIAIVAVPLLGSLLFPPTGST